MYEIIIAILTIVISLSALLYSFYCGYKIDKHHERSINSSLYKEIILNEIALKELPYKINEILKIETLDDSQLLVIRELKKIINEYSDSILVYKFYDSKIYILIKGDLEKIEDIAISKLYNSINKNDKMGFERGKEEFLLKVEDLYKHINDKYYK